MSSKPCATDDRKTYERPRLTAYGKLRDLTAGGTGNANESSNGQRPRP